MSRRLRCLRGERLFPFQNNPVAPLGYPLPHAILSLRYEIGVVLILADGPIDKSETVLRGTPGYVTLLIEIRALLHAKDLVDAAEVELVELQTDPRFDLQAYFLLS